MFKVFEFKIDIIKLNQNSKHQNKHKKVDKQAKQNNLKRFG